MKSPDPEKENPAVVGGANESADSHSKVPRQLPPVNPEVADELLRAALKRTQEFLTWQKRKQAEARGKCIIAEGADQ